MKRIPGHDSGLRYHGEDLCWEKISLPTLASQYGTPLYVVNGNRLKKTYLSFLDAFLSEGLRTAVFYSFKTNPIPDILKVMVEAGVGAEIISPYELWLARRLGVTGSRIIVNGTVKSPAFVEEAVAVEAALINVESIEELRMLQAIAIRMNKAAKVGLRINPALKSSRFDFTVSTGTASSPMGFIAGSPSFQAALDLLASSEVLKLHGLHCHIGSGISSAAPYAHALEIVLRLWADLWRRGFQPEVLDLGGGFNVPSLKALTLWEAVRLFGWNKSLKPPSLNKRADLQSDVARVCKEQLHAFKKKKNLPIPTIYLEPGRALSATSQILLLSVESIIERDKNAPCALCDGGAMSLSPMLFSEYHSILRAKIQERGSHRVYNLLGNMPTPLDIVALQRDLPTLAPGDILAILDVGAYFTSLGNTFAGPRPAVVLIEDRSDRLIRRRETYNDLVARDLNLTINDDHVKRDPADSM